MVAAWGSRHHLIVVADVEGFGDPRRTGPHQRAVREGLYEVMASTFAAAGTTWGACYREDRGDAVFALIPADTDKAIFVQAALPSLVTGLRVHNDTHPDPERIRLRVALHAGEVSYDEHGVTSRALTLAFRLCDAPPLKAALAASPGVLAVIASDWLFDEVVRHLPATAPATWRPVAVTVKEAATTGWLTLPDHPYSTDPIPAETGSGSPTIPASRTGSGGVVPRQLPATVRDFTGRCEQLAALDALIPPGPGPQSLDKQRARSVVITAVDGVGGIGKTTLALHWAHRVQDRFPDGTLHVNLRGYGPGEPATSAEALGGFLRGLNVAPRAIPTEIEAQAALLRSLLADKRLLMVLDNAHSAEQIRPLLPGAPGCMVVITSRDSLTGLVVTDAAHRLTLDLLTEREALDLVASILGTDRADIEPDAVRELIRLCARLPLALRIAASRAATHPHLTVADVVAELADDHTRLDVLSETGDERAAVRAVFDWSYQRLPQKQARLFRRLGLHPGPDLSLPAAAALAALSPAESRPLLSALTSAHLIEPAAGGRYRFHDLLRAYAVEQADLHDTRDDRDRALEGLLTWYIHTARAADHLLFHLCIQVPAVVAEPDHPHPLADLDEAWAWLTSEGTNLLAAVQHTINHQLDHHTIPLAHACRFLASAGSPQDLIEVYSDAVIAARRIRNHNQEITLLFARLEMVAALGFPEKCQADLDRVDALAQHVDDTRLQLDVVHTRGWLFLKLGQFDEAMRLLERAWPLSKGIDTGRWEAVVRGNLSIAHLGLGHDQIALEHSEHSLRLRRQAEDITGEAWALMQQARVRRSLGEFDKAIALCREALAIGNRFPRNRNEIVAEPLEVLATCLHQVGHTDEAITCWQQAATIYDDTGYAHKAIEVRQLLEDALP